MDWFSYKFRVARKLMHEWKVVEITVRLYFGAGNGEEEEQGLGACTEINGCSGESWP